MPPFRPASYKAGAKATPGQPLGPQGRQIAQAEGLLDCHAISGFHLFRYQLSSPMLTLLYCFCADMRCFRHIAAFSCHAAASARHRQRRFRLPFSRFHALHFFVSSSITSFFAFHFHYH